MKANSKKMTDEITSALAAATFVNTTAKKMMKKIDATAKKMAKTITKGHCKKRTKASNNS